MRSVALVLGMVLMADRVPPVAATPPGAAAQPAGAVPGPAAAPGAVAFCAGDYADDFSVLLARARELEQRQPAYTFCIRSRATYECPFYGGDGGLRRIRKTAVAHGTGFAYRQQDGGTLLLTNDHVAEWPPVTDEDHQVEGVPAGCRRVSDALKIVDGESDEYEPDDVPLSRVVVDPQLDVAVLKARTALPVMPWKVGRSSGLRERNVVNVRGFPLGVFNADNVGKVISAYDHDDFKEWDHDDFVIDALLSPGNSGSPVFAISCKTGEFELVGIFHAAYVKGSALNVVVGIDQVRDLMTTLKRTPRSRSDAVVALDARTRSRLVEMARGAVEPHFPFGGLAAAVRVRADGALVFDILSHEFPLETAPVLVMEDLPPAVPEAFGTLGRVWVGNQRGMKAYQRTDLEGEAQGQVLRILDALRRAALGTLAYREAEAAADGSKARFQQVTRLQRTLRRTVASRQYLSQLASDLAERLGPESGDPVVQLADALAVPAPSGASVPPAMPSPEEGHSGAAPPLATQGPGAGAATSATVTAVKSP
jgi:S1-C subfamily serine protease